MSNGSKPPGWKEGDPEPEHKPDHDKDTDQAEKPETEKPAE